MAYELPSAVEIDRKLRQDFRDRLKEFGISAETTDPVLAVLFRTFAVELEALYSETGRIRTALLDELIEGLGVDRRRPRSAQTVVRLLPKSGQTAQLPAGAELLGETESGERLVFTTDAPITPSAARIAMAFAYQDGMLRLLSGVDPSEQIQTARPSLEPVRAALGAYPAIYLAIENLPDAHLSGQGFFFDLGPDTDVVLRALRNEPWCLAGPDGDFSAAGILRPQRRNAGIRRLEWLVRTESDADEQQAAPSEDSLRGPIATDTPELPDGYYAGRVLTFPSAPPERRFLCGVPRAMEKAMRSILGTDAPRLLEQPRAWLRISMGPDAPPLDEAILNITLNAVTASNAECFNETIRFAEHGTTIPISREAGASKLLVAPLSVFGEGARAYAPQFHPSTEAGLGRYAIHNGRIHLSPARRGDGSADTYANLRMWLTSGEAGNRVGPGKIQSFLKQGAAPAVRVINPTSAAGGSDGETFESAQRRFAAALLNRNRIITDADMIAAAKAYDSRIRTVTTELGLERGETGALHRVHRVRCVFDQDAFTDPAEELRILRQELERHLEGRMIVDSHLKLEAAWA